MLIRRILLIIALSAVALTACDQVPDAATDLEALGTAVAATLIAEAQTDAGASTPPTMILATEEPTEAPGEGSSTAPVLTLSDFLLAYTHEGNLWVLTTQDPARQLTPSGAVIDVLVADDRQIIVYIRQSYQPDLFEVRAINVDGGEDRQILSQEALDALFPLDAARHFLISQMEFIPRTHSLLFNTHAVFDGPGLLLNDDLHRLDVDTGEHKQILARGAGGQFSISPDGRQIAIARAESLSLVDIEGTHYRPDLVTFDPIVTYSEYQYYPAVVWAVDSSSVASFIPSADPLGEQPTGTVWVIPSDGSPFSKAPIPGQTFFPQSNGRSLLSPDLQTLALQRQDPGSQVMQLYLANADGSDTRMYDQGDTQWVGWSTGGANFAYRRGQSQLTLGTPGSAPQPLADGVAMRWLSDELFLIQSGQRGEWSLSLGSVTGEMKPLVQPAGDVFVYDIR